MAVQCRYREEEFDVIITGGGMSGICAAIACARQGVKTALVHGNPVLGGNASSEIRMHICGASSNMTKENMEETGILHEILLDNKYVNDFYNFSIWDTVLLQKVKNTQNLTLFLNTVMYDAHTENSSIQSISCYQITTEITMKLSAKIFIDCTGNGTLGFFAGAEYRIGSESKSEFNEPHAPDEPNNYTMGNTLLFKAIDRGRPVIFKTPEWAYHFTEEQLKYRIHSGSDTLNNKDKENFKTILDESHLIKKENTFEAYCLDYGYWWIELGGTSKDIIEEYEDIRDQLIRCIYGIWDHIKNGGDHGAENYDLEWVGMLPGTRESRRLVGDYILNENDVLGNHIFEDAVAYGGWPIDNHTPKGLFDFDNLPASVWWFPGVYTIPYRCYYSKNVNNLMMAGRIISASKLAMASSRVMGTCSVGGQAAGVAAAMCIKYGCNPKGINAHISELQQLLIKDDCYIPGFNNEDERDYARKAVVTASGELKGMEAVNVINGFTRTINDNSNLWESDGISKDGEILKLSLEVPALIKQIRITFDSNLSRSMKITLSSKRIKQQQVGVPKELVKDFEITLWNNGNPVRSRKVEGNYQRLFIQDFEETMCDLITIKVTSTNGIPNVRIFEVRAY